MAAPAGRSDELATLRTCLDAAGNGTAQVAERDPWAAIDVGDVPGSPPLRGRRGTRTRAGLNRWLLVTVLVTWAASSQLLDNSHR